MGGYIFYALFFGAPVAAVIFFIVSLILFLKASKTNKKTPGVFSASVLATRRVLLIISSVIAIVTVSVVVTIVSLVYMALAYM